MLACNCCRFLSKNGLFYRHLSCSMLACFVAVHRHRASSAMCCGRWHTTFRQPIKHIDWPSSALSIRVSMCCACFRYKTRNDRRRPDLDSPFDFVTAFLHDALSCSHYPLMMGSCDLPACRPSTSTLFTTRICL